MHGEPETCAVRAAAPGAEMAHGIWYLLLLPPAEKAFDSVRSCVLAANQKDTKKEMPVLHVFFGLLERNFLFRKSFTADVASRGHGQNGRFVETFAKTADLLWGYALRKPKSIPSAILSFC